VKRTCYGAHDRQKTKTHLDPALPGWTYCRWSEYCEPRAGLSVIAICSISWPRWCGRAVKARFRAFVRLGHVTRQTPVSARAGATLGLNSGGDSACGFVMQGLGDALVGVAGEGGG
jgi:hypothetical protein